MSRASVTRMVEDYVTLIWKAYEWPGGEPSTTDLAAQLGVTASTVSANLKKLARDGFLHYEPYGRIELTGEGRQVAVAVVRRHRILETYLVRRLGLTWDQVHEEADRLEHAVSDLVLDRMDAALGHPARDPHGDPIPAADGSVPADDSYPLSEASQGQVVDVVRVSDRSADVLRYLQEREITPGARLRIAEVHTAAGTIRVDTAASSVELSTVAASALRVAAPSGR
ncbi:metal-dependent transcriptional regulator [Microbacterium sp. SORGH_AS_0888]|uniref:metal-dependent transcriptional regulator n=1 Tax=Microbacterium sp. SORGH_AS_0888 TaxID=3041791 RepID=UPI0027D90BDF|nr:metal-dependent transcriptional regulator [Microbacterium sp. SORGH_AS_0888]